MPFTKTGNWNAPLAAADSGTTISFITKYTTTPYANPQRIGLAVRNLTRRLARKNTSTIVNAME